jgi:hypothetical protein
MIILRWVFVVAVVGLVLAALSVVDVAGLLVRKKFRLPQPSPGSRLARVAVRNS